MDRVHHRAKLGGLHLLPGIGRRVPAAARTPYGLSHLWAFLPKTPTKGTKPQKRALLFFLSFFLVVVFLRHAFPPTSCCKRSVPNRQGDPWVMLTTKRTFADGRAARVSCYLSAHLRLAEHPIKASLPPHTLVGLQLSL